MHKVVYNTCYGGFGLSRKAALMLVELNTRGFSMDDFKAQDKCGLKSFYIDEEIIPRHHPNLIKVVETLGEKANGSGASLKIFNIQGDRYRIEEYDGMEAILEPEDLDWIVIR